VPYPTEKQIDSLSSKAMHAIDLDSNETIDFGEFCNWIKNDEEIQ
jgi:hypothetical protein